MKNNHSRRKKDTSDAIIGISGATKLNGEVYLNAVRPEMDTHSDACKWKEIMRNLNYKNKYECQSCDGYDLRCSANTNRGRR